MNVENFVEQINELEFQTELDCINKVAAEVEGFSGPYVMKLLNMAISNMEDDEYFLEIGTHQGRTLIGGLVGNESKDAVAVDNFSMFNNNTKAKLLANIEKFDMKEQICFLEIDTSIFFQTQMPRENGNVGVYFYDGNHNTEQGLKGLCDAVPYLADEAVIILDDFSSHGVWLSVFQFLAKYPAETALLFSMRTNGFPFPHEMWWNGIVIIHWKSDRNISTGT